jgi:hypothetical protein
LEIELAEGNEGDEDEEEEGEISELVERPANKFEDKDKPSRSNRVRTFFL